MINISLELNKIHWNKIIKIHAKTQAQQERIAQIKMKISFTLKNYEMAEKEKTQLININRDFSIKSFQFSFKTLLRRKYDFYGSYEELLSLSSLYVN